MLAEALAHAIACAIQCETKKLRNTIALARLSANASQAERGLSWIGRAFERRNGLVAACRFARHGLDSCDVGEQGGQQIDRIGIWRVAVRWVGVSVHLL